MRKIGLPFACIAGLASCGLAGPARSQAEEKAVACSPDKNSLRAWARAQAGWSIYVFGSYSMDPTIIKGTPLKAEVMVRHRPVMRGDVIVYCVADDPDTNWVHRVVAIGSDRIRVDGARVILNGTPLERQPIPAPASTEPGAGPRNCYRERLDAHSYRTCEPRDVRLAGTAEIIVPEGVVFTVADNRGTGRDSRYPGRGPIPEALILAIVRAKSVGGLSVTVDD